MKLEIYKNPDTLSSQKICYILVSRKGKNLIKKLAFGSEEGDVTELIKRKKKEFNRMPYFDLRTIKD